MRCLGRNNQRIRRLRPSSSFLDEALLGSCTGILVIRSEARDAARASNISRISKISLTSESSSCRTTICRALICSSSPTETSSRIASLTGARDIPSRSARSRSVIFAPAAREPLRISSSVFLRALLLSDSDIGLVLIIDFGIPYNYFSAIDHKFFDLIQILVLQNILRRMYNYGIFRCLLGQRSRIIRSIGSIK